MPTEDRPFHCPVHQLAYAHLVSQIIDGFVAALTIGNHRQLWRAGGIEAFGFGGEH